MVYTGILTGVMFSEYEDRPLKESAKELAQSTARLRQYLDHLEAEDEASRLGRWPKPEFRLIRAGARTRKRGATLMWPL